MVVILDGAMMLDEEEALERAVSFLGQARRMLLGLDRGREGEERERERERERD